MTAIQKLEKLIAATEKAIKNPKTKPAFVVKFKTLLSQQKNKLKLLQHKKKGGSSPAKLGSRFKKLFRENVQQRKKQHLMTNIDAVERDAGRPAKKAGKRITDGKHFPYKKGNVYYEKRANRSDKRQPAKKYPMLEKGGELNGYTLETETVKKYNAKATPMMKFYHEGSEGEKERKVGYVLVWKHKEGGSGARFFKNILELESAKEKMITRGYAKGGDVNDKWFGKPKPRVYEDHELVAESGNMYPLKTGGNVDVYYSTEYYDKQGGHGETSSSPDFETQYKKAIELYNREKKQKQLGKSTGFIGVSGSGDKFAIIYVDKEYVDMTDEKWFKDKSGYEKWHEAAIKCLETGKPQKSSFEKGGYLKHGGKIENQYDGKAAEEVWSEWTVDQRKHFLLDHSELLDKDRYENDLGYSRSVQKDRLYSELTEMTKKVLAAHVNSGEYKLGGRVKTIKDTDIKEGEKFELANGEVIEIKRIFKDKNPDNETDYVEFTRSSEPESVKENSVKELRIFINNWRKDAAEKGMRLNKDWVGNKTKESWGKHKLYEMYENNLDLCADLVDYFNALEKDIDKRYADEMKRDVIKALQTGKITSNDNSTLTFATGGKVGGYKRLANKLMLIDSRVWDEVDATGGDELRGDKEKMKLYAKKWKAHLIELGYINEAGDVERVLPKEVGDVIEDESYATLFSFLKINGIFGDAEKKREINFFDEIEKKDGYKRAMVYSLDSKIVSVKEV